MPHTAAMAESDLEKSVDLLRRAQAGDEEACNDLLARYLPRLERWASRKLPLTVRTMLDTGDIVQEAMVRALRHLNTIEIRSDKTLEVYLKRAISNRIIDMYRKPRRDYEEVNEQLAAAGPTALDEAIGHQARERYEDALDTLSDADCQIITMHTDLGMTAAQIGEELGKSSEAARMALTRALKRLAAAMQQQTR